MIIEKVMNNNCVQASMNGQEVIISGPGVGYNKKYGMLVPEHPANRIFYVRNEQKNKLYKLIEHVDIEYVFVAEKNSAICGEKSRKKSQSIATIDSCGSHFECNIPSRFRYTN